MKIMPQHEDNRSSVGVKCFPRATTHHLDGLDSSPTPSTGPVVGSKQALGEGVGESSHFRLGVQHARSV